MSKLLFCCDQQINQPVNPIHSRIRRRIIQCLLLVACLLAFPSPASFGKIYWFVWAEPGDQNTVYSVQELEDGTWHFAIHDLRTNEILHEEEILDYTGNPNPSDPDSGLIPDHEQIMNELKKLEGGSLELDRDPLNNWLIQNLIDQGKVPGGAIDPWELGGFMMENPDGGGLPGGFDMGMPLGEIINQLKRSGSSGGSDNENLDFEVPPSYGTTGLEDFGPSIPWVNPIPIWMYYKTQELLNDR